MVVDGPDARGGCDPAVDSEDGVPKGDDGDEVPRNVAGDSA